MRVLLTVLLLAGLCGMAGAIAIDDVYEVPAGSGYYGIVMTVVDEGEGSMLYGVSAISFTGSEFGPATMADETRTRMYYPPEAFGPDAPEGLAFVRHINPRAVTIADPDSGHDGWTLWDVRNGRVPTVPTASQTPTPDPTEAPTPEPTRPAPVMLTQRPTQPTPTAPPMPTTAAAVAIASPAPAQEPVPAPVVPRFGARRYVIGDAPNLPGVVTIGTVAPEAVPTIRRGIGVGIATGVRPPAARFVRWSPSARWSLRR